MSEQITWTHVDKMVRKMLDDRGMLQTGMNDAEVTYNLIKYLQRHERVLEVAKQQVENTLANERRLGDVLKKEILDLKSSKGRTKKRLDALEKAVAELQRISVYGRATVTTPCCEHFPDCVCGMGADGL